VRLVKIPNIDYQTFQLVRNTLYASIPYALISNTYCDNTAFFQFWDESYIPAELHAFIQSPVNPSLLTSLNNQLKPILKTLGAKP